MATALDFQSQIIREIGDPNGTIAKLVPAVWALYTEKATLDPSLQALYAKRALLDVRLAEEQPSIDFTVGGDVTDKQSQRFTHLEQMREDCHAEILRVEALVTMGRVPVAGTLCHTVPHVPRYGPDPNSSVYRGSPIRRRVDPWHG